MDASELSGIAKVLHDTPLAGFCAVLILFICAMAGFLLYLHRCNVKAEQEDTQVKLLLAQHLAQLSSRIGRLIKARKTAGDIIPDDIDDDDETILLVNILKNGKKGTPRCGD